MVHGGLRSKEARHSAAAAAAGAAALQVSCLHAMMCMCVLKHFTMTRKLAPEQR